MLQEDKGLTLPEPQKLWNRYLLALFLIASFLTISFSISEYAAHKSHDNAELINMAGRQRMLSQRIILFSHYYGNEIQQGIAASDNLKTLQADFKLFKTSHEELIHGNPLKDISAKTGRIAADIYFTPPYMLDNKVQTQLSYTSTILYSKNLSTRIEAIAQLNALNNTDYLEALDLVVNRLEKNAQHEHKRLINIGRISFALALLVLILEARFIFFPIHRNLVQFAEKYQTRQSQKKS